MKGGLGGGDESCVGPATLSTSIRSVQRTSLTKPPSLGALCAACDLRSGSLYGSQTLCNTWVIGILACFGVYWRLPGKGIGCG